MWITLKIRASRARSHHHHYHHYYHHHHWNQQQQQTMSLHMHSAYMQGSVTCARAFSLTHDFVCILFLNKQLKITSFFSLHLLLFCIYFYSFYFCFGAVAWIFYHRFEFKTLLYSICFGSELLLSSSSFLYIFMCCCCCCFCFRVRFFSHLLLCRAHLR